MFIKVLYFLFSQSYQIGIIFKQFYLMRPKQVLLLQVIVDLGVMAMVLHTPQIFTTGVSTIRYSLVSYPGHPFFEKGVLLRCRVYSQHILSPRRCQWGNGYRRRKWTRRHEFKSWTDCISHSTNTLGKGMNPIILPPAMGK